MENSFSNIQNSVMLARGRKVPANKQTSSKNPLAIKPRLALLSLIFITLYTHSLRLYALGDQGDVGHS